MPWRDTGHGVEIMLITSRDTGRWVLPKGWPEAKELLCEAAAREAGEEAGLRGTVSHHEAGRYFYAKALASGEEVPCEVLVFPLRVDKIADRWKEKRVAHPQMGQPSRGRAHGQRAGPWPDHRLFLCRPAPVLLSKHRPTGQSRASPAMFFGKGNRFGHSSFGMRCPADGLRVD